MSLQVTIVIPAFEEEAHIGAALAALQAQDPANHPGGNSIEAEILVVDDGSTDRTAQVAAAAPAPRFPVRVVRHERNQGRIMARRTGAMEARYPLLFFTDARCRAYPDLLARLATAGKEPLMGVAVGCEDPGTVDRAYALVRRRVYPRVAQPTAITPAEFDRFAKGMGVVLMSKERFLRHCPARPEELTSDDTALLRRVVEETPLWVDPGVRIAHRENRGLWRVARHMYYRGRTYKDYYLAPGSRRRRVFSAGLVATLTVALAGAAVLAGFPAARLPVLAAGGVALAAGLACGLVYLAERPADLPALLGWGFWSVPFFVAGLLAPRTR